MPLRPVPPRPPRAAATAVVAALAAALPALAAAPAGAAVPTVRAPGIVTPLPPATGLASVVPAAGDGLVAWAVPGPPPAGGHERPVALWTLRGGVPTVATTVPVRGRPLSLELGTERGGAPVAVLRTTEDADDAPVVTRLVRLDTGAARRLPLRRRGRLVHGMALDRGRLYYVLGPHRSGPRTRSTFWRATLTGLTLRAPVRLRTSRPGEWWYADQADRGLVAVYRSTIERDGGQTFDLQDVGFGTPRGRWSGTEFEVYSDGPADTVSVAGFTADGRSIVTVRADEGRYGQTASVTPVGARRPARRVHLWDVPLDLPDGDPAPPILDPATGRLLGVGPAPGSPPPPDEAHQGPTAFGFSGPAVPVD
ncbi:hypothetical protein [Patulibacter sp. SYSU D01012]|uniref:hypothetical protein n=1 Tax=Patulibacter sp. SYSU D01012 TaxID=2817381 RepID=UPI001B301AD2|nr:hypothetical protein [Patulibacter sp. SYSU D01012]